MIIFSDAKSVLQALNSERSSPDVIQKLSSAMDHFMKEFNQEITLQWIPSHCEINGNERADNLAKKGASKLQPDKPISQTTCKEIIRSNTKIEWVNNWALGNTGRVMLNYMTAPRKTDNLDSLGRRDQSIIFRLRSQYIALNKHLNRLNPMHEPVCPVCPATHETVTHFLFECPQLSQLRKAFLPPSPNIGNTLYGDTDQLKRTAQYFILANRRRTNVQ